MKLDTAQNLVTNLKENLTNEYWGHIYDSRQNGLLPEEDWEYDVYVEYNGEFNLDRMGELLNLAGGLTYTLAIPTRQIIIW